MKKNNIQKIALNKAIHTKVESNLSELFSNEYDDTIDSEVLMGRIKNLMTKRELLKKYEIKQGKGKDKRYYVRINKKAVFFHATFEEVLEDLIKYEKSSVDFNNTNATLADIYESFCAYRSIKQAPGTCKLDRRIYNQYVSNTSILNVPLREIGIDDIVTYFNECLEISGGMKKSEWSKCKATLSAMLNYAIETRKYDINYNPARDFKPNTDHFIDKKRTPDSELIYSKEEEAVAREYAFKEAIEKHSAIPLGIVCLFELGLRINELTALKWRDIEEQNGKKFIHIQRSLISDSENGIAKGKKVVPHGKTAKANRRIELTSTMLSVLSLIRVYNEENGKHIGIDDFIFQRPNKGPVPYCTERSFQRILERCCKAANTEVFKSFHDIRRTVCTNLFYAGMPMKDLQKFMGHEDMETTHKYIKEKEDSNTINYLETLAKSAKSSKIVDFSTVQRTATQFHA